MYKIKFLKPNIPKIDVSDILESGEVTNGKYVRELEKLLCKMHHAKYAVCFSSATACLLLLMKGNYYNHCMQSFTWKTPKIIAEEILGDVPVYLDIDKNTWTVPKKYQKQIKIPMILTATLGRIPDIVYPKRTIVDGATNAGYFDMKKHPCLALIVGFSPSKMITGIEGGAVITNSKKIYTNLKELQPSMFRMGEINAMIAIYNLKLAKGYRRQKEILYHIYKDRLPFAKFQKIDKNHSLNEIAAVFPFNEKQWKEVEKGMEVRKRYDPNGIGKNAVEVYKGVMSLPSYSGCDYKGVIRLLRKVYYGK